LWCILDDDNDDDGKKTKDGDSTSSEDEEIDASDNKNNKKEDDKTKTKFSSEDVAANFVATAGKVIGNARDSLQKAASKAGIIDEKHVQQEKATAKAS